MNNDSKSGKIKSLTKHVLNLPSLNAINNSKTYSEVQTNVLRVPFGTRVPKKKRPDKNQNIATLILPLNSFSDPTPPPQAA